MTPYEREAKPFGGKLQLIVCGDFMQLPPVQKDKNKASTSNKAKKSDKKESLMNAPQAGPMGGKAVPMYGSFETNGKPAFMSVVWREAKLQMKTACPQMKTEGPPCDLHGRVINKSTTAIK